MERALGAADAADLGKGLFEVVRRHQAVVPEPHLPPTRDALGGSVAVALGVARRRVVQACPQRAKTRQRQHTAEQPWQRHPGGAGRAADGVVDERRERARRRHARRGGRDLRERFVDRAEPRRAELFFDDANGRLAIVQERVEQMDVADVGVSPGLGFVHREAKGQGKPRRHPRGSAEQLEHARDDAREHEGHEAYFRAWAHGRRS